MPKTLVAIDLTETANNITVTREWYGVTEYYLLKIENNGVTFTADLSKYDAAALGEALMVLCGDAKQISDIITHTEHPTLAGILGKEKD